MMFRLLGIGLCLSVCMLSGACERKRRFDGTCTDDSHCLDIQKCAGGVCVRREAIFKQPDREPKSIEPAAIQRTQRNPSTPVKPVEEPETPDPRPNGKQPRDRTTPDRKGTFRFRLDA